VEITGRKQQVSFAVSLWTRYRERTREVDVSKNKIYLQT